jgi:hypothetical protein
MVRMKEKKIQIPGRNRPAQLLRVGHFQKFVAKIQKWAGQYS